MKAHDLISESEALVRELVRLHERRELHDGTETFIHRAGAYLSGMPYVWSTDARRAYIFRDREQAEEVIDKFPLVLAGAEVSQFHAERRAS